MALLYGTVQAEGVSQSIGDFAKAAPAMGVASAGSRIRKNLSSLLFWFCQLFHLFEPSFLQLFMDDKSLPKAAVVRIKQMYIEKLTNGRGLLHGSHFCSSRLPNLFSVIRCFADLLPDVSEGKKTYLP